jgi:transcriptional regulator with XRE-family HTH domain
VVDEIALALESVRSILQSEPGSPVVKKTPNPVDRHVGSRVRMRRILLGMSQEKLGEQLQLTFQQIQKYEKGMNRIGASRLQQISRILGVPVEYFFEGAPQLSERPPVENGFDDQGDATYEGVQLNRAFLKIKDPKLRRRVVELVTAIAGDDLAA